MAREPIDTAWLRVFDAAARLKNLTHAAADLGITQPAVSYQIRRLEDRLGVPLFRRGHRGMELSDEGEVLFRAVHGALAAIDDAARRVRQAARTPVVRLYTDFAFASYWLMPRVAAFRDRHPGVDVHIVAAQGLAAALDDGIDLAVVFGRREDFGPDATLVLGERVVPVCGPGFAARSGLSGAAADLVSVPLLHLDGGSDDRWFTWRSFLGRHDVVRDPAPGDLKFNVYNLVLQAALADQGVALGWGGLVDAFLAAGSLVPAGPELSRDDHGYWLIRSGSPSRAAGVVLDWLVAEIGPGSDVTNSNNF